MPSLTPVDESFLTTAPQIFTHTWEIARPADSVWSELVGDQPLSWITGFSISWNTKPPFGVGTTRTASVLGLVKVTEQYFIWEEGRRKAFFGAAMNLPLFAKLAEDYVVEPRGADACAFTWTVAVEPSTLGKPGAPINKLLFGQAFKDTGKHFRAA
jgi:hypothetical protein